MINFVIFNALRSTNSFRRKEIHKFTWTNRGYRSIIRVDYILDNIKISSKVNDTRIYRSYDVSSDHFVVLSTINIRTKWITNKRPSVNIRKEYFKIHILREDSTRDYTANV
jgi:hypothetical protein